MILTAVSCSVYDASLLGSGPAEGGSGGTNSSAGHSGSGDDTAGHSGTAGASKGGSGGSMSGDAGMMDAAGAGGDSSEGGTSGSGGTAGATGGTSTGGTGGTSAGTGGESIAGSGGTGGSGGSGGGSAGAGGSAMAGCAKLSVPIDDQNDRAHFVISLPSTNMTTGVISMHLYVQAGAAGTVFNYVQDASNNWFGVTTAQRPLLTSIVGWQTLTFDVGAQPAAGGIAKGDIRRIGIEINAAPATSGWSKPTVVFIDSITVATPTLSYTFDMANTVQTAPSGSDVANQVLWQHSGGTDTTATGTTLAWQQTCP